MLRNGRWAAADGGPSYAEAGGADAAHTHRAKTRPPPRPHTVPSPAPQPSLALWTVSPTLPFLV
eukprot:scaffold5921_cov123-Isochrysis_galbana.AAC.3